ncbi:MAG: aldolase/citrate lyase family protein, partial [Rhodothermales bacterium]
AMIESAEALANLSEILSVEGLDGVYVGPVDLSISMGLPELGNLDDPQLRQAVGQILAATNKHNLVAGVHASSPTEAALLSEWGFRLVTPVNDSKMLRLAAAETLKQTRNVIK